MPLKIILVYNEALKDRKIIIELKRYDIIKIFAHRNTENESFKGSDRRRE